MSEENNDVDLEALLAKAESDEAETSGASDQETVVPKDTDISPSEDEASLRAQERIRELVEENNRLKGSQNEFNDLDTFINAIEDEPSKKLLQTYGDLLEKKIAKQYSPVVDNYTASKFDKEFDALASRVPSLSVHKEDLKKTYQRNPNTSVKALVGELLTENLLARIKPIERKASTASRGTPDLSGASKDELYAALENMKQ